MIEVEKRKKLMLQELKPAIKYQEKFISTQRNPVVVLRNLLQAGLISNYVMYEGKNEVRIALKIQFH